MSDDSLRRQIEAILAGTMNPPAAEPLVAVCWPGGAADRSEPAALQWLRRWRPARAAAPLPACSCRSGRCAVCN